jgi:hypothetical protein
VTVLEAKWAILLALGQRRAAATRYLTQRNIDADRIDITTFGEERPTVRTLPTHVRNAIDEMRFG